MATSRSAAVSPSSLGADPIGVALDAYLEATQRRFQDVLRAQLATLAEPSARVATDPARALRLVGYGVETLAGFARGAALEPLANLLRRLADDAGKAKLRALVATGIAATSPATTAAVASIALVPRMLADAARRPLVDDFGARLYLRLATDLADLRAIARTLAAAAAPGAAAAIPALAALADDDASAIRFGDQLRHGWGTCLTAIASRRGVPQIAHGRSRELWLHWLRTVRGEIVAHDVEFRVGERTLTPDHAFMQIG